MKKVIPQLSYEIDAAGDVQLEQDGGMGDRYYVTLHRSQVQAIAEEVGLLPVRPAAADAAMATRLVTLRDRLAELHEMLRCIPCFPQGNSENDPETLFCKATLEIAEAFCADLGATDSVAGSWAVRHTGHAGSHDLFTQGSNTQ